MDARCQRDPEGTGDDVHLHVVASRWRRGSFQPRSAMPCRTGCEEGCVPHSKQCEGYFLNLVKIQRLKFGGQPVYSGRVNQVIEPWSLDFYTMRFWGYLLHFFRDTFMIKLENYVNFLKLCLLMPTFLLSSKSNCFHGSDSSDVSEGPNENHVEISFDKATSDKRNAKQIALHNGKWWTRADPCWWLGAKGKFEATHMFPFGKLSGFNVQLLCTI